MAQRRVIIDTDPGIDDTMALLLALASPELKIEALTITHGNSRDVNLLARNACALLEMAGRTEIPVYVGSGLPLVQSNLRGGEIVHGANAMGGVEIPHCHKMPVEGVPAASYIVKACMHDYPNQITIIALGPLTNIALALKLAPQLPNFVKDFYIMGGAVGVPGNITPVAEANFHNDAEAARLVMSAGWKVHMIALNVTNTMRFDDDYFKDLEKLGKWGSFITRISRFYMKFHNEVVGWKDSPVHDPSAIMVVVCPEVFPEHVELFIDVETKGTLTHGMCIGDFAGQYNKPPQTILYTKVNEALFKQKYKERIASLRE